MIGIDKSEVQEIRRPFIALHNREMEIQENELVRLDGMVGELLQEVGALLPLTGDGCPVDGSLPCADRESVVYDGQLRELLLSVRSATTTIEKLQNQVSTALANLRMVHRQLVGEKPCDLPIPPPGMFAAKGG